MLTSKERLSFLKTVQNLKYLKANDLKSLNLEILGKYRKKNKQKNKGIF